MKKNLPEDYAETRPGEKQSEMKPKGAGRKITWILLYITVVIVILLVVYYLTSYNTDTFKINNIN